MIEEVARLTPSVIPIPGILCVVAVVGLFFIAAACLFENLGGKDK